MSRFTCLRTVSEVSLSFLEMPQTSLESRFRNVLELSQTRLKTYQNQWKTYQNHNINKPFHGPQAISKNPLRQTSSIIYQVTRKGATKTQTQQNTTNLQMINSLLKCLLQVAPNQTFLGYPFDGVFLLNKGFVSPPTLINPSLPPRQYPTTH